MAVCKVSVGEIELWRTEDRRIMGYTRKIIGLIRVAIADSVIDIAEIVVVGTVIGINGNKSTRKRYKKFSFNT